MSAGWKGSLIIEVVGHREFTVRKNLVYEDDDGTVYEIPELQDTDLGSTWSWPIVAERYDGCFPMSCVLHDWAYKNGTMPRKDADNLFYHACYWEDIYYETRGKDGMGMDIAYQMWLGVRGFGASSYKGKPEWNN